MNAHLACDVTDRSSAWAAATLLLLTLSTHAAPAPFAMMLPYVPQIPARFNPI